ncbi:MAG: recombination-associated protein RdgC [Amphritea sp.]|nr:recombination-associated protein RdgC [Amphritea sp.]
MFFKNAIVYRLTAAIVSNMTDKLAEKPFISCGSQEFSRVGWVPPSDLFEEPHRSLAGVTLICLQKEEKILPPAVVRQELDAKVKLIESEQARKVYRKEKDQLKDEIVMDLLPRAFSKISKTYALILGSEWVIVDATSHKRAEELLSHLRSLLGSLPVILPDVQHSPSAVMSQWLEHPESRPTGIQLLDESELRDSALEAGVIRCKGQDLESEEITQHLEAGKRVTKLAIEWQETLSFVLTDDLKVNRIRLTDQLQEKIDQDGSDMAVDRFDTELTQMKLEFDRLIPAILAAFGGAAERA